MENTSGLDPNLLLAKMGENQNDDKSWWLILLLLLYGKRGLGEESAGVRTCATLADLNAAQNSLQQCMNAFSQISQEQFNNITRDIAADALRNETGQMNLAQQISTQGYQNLNGQKDILAAICDCCCKFGLSVKDVERAISENCCETRNAINVQGLSLQNAVDKCCCETQNSIALQTNVLQQAICNDGEKTRALITDNRIQDLQAQLQISRDENSNLRQTAALSEQIRNVCGPPPLCRCVYPHPHGGNGPPGPPMG